MPNQVLRLNVAFSLIAAASPCCYASPSDKPPRPSPVDLNEFSDFCQQLIVDPVLQASPLSPELIELSRLSTGFYRDASPSVRQKKLQYVFDHFIAELLVADPGLSAIKDLHQRFQFIQQFAKLPVAGVMKIDLVKALIGMANATKIKEERILIIDQLIDMEERTDDLPLKAFLESEIDKL